MRILNEPFTGNELMVIKPVNFNFEEIHVHHCTRDMDVMFFSAEKEITSLRPVSSLKSINLKDQQH